MTNVQCSMTKENPMTNVRSRHEHPPDFGARPPRALQRPNCKRAGVLQRRRLLGACCGRGGRAPRRFRRAPASGAAAVELQACWCTPAPSSPRGLLRPGRPRSGNAFGARPPRALQRPNCKRAGVLQRRRLLGACCGRGGRAPGRWRVHRARQERSHAPHAPHAPNAPNAPTLSP